MRLRLLSALLTIAVLSSCKKTAGEGGNSSIRGSIWVEDWNSNFKIKNGEYAGADVEVYIIYGDNVSYSERIRTNYNGEYEFKYLRRGNYKVYVYSKDSTMKSPSGMIAIVKDIEIKERKETVNVEQITIFD